jgi:hypothetical protein
MDEQKIKEQAEQIVEKIKASVKDGGGSRVLLKRHGETLMNLSLNTGMIGAVVGLKLAPFAVLTTALVSFGLDCEIELEKEDGTVINLNRTPVGMKLEEIKENAIDKTKEIIDKVKGMSGAPSAYTDTDYTADAADAEDAADPFDAQ